MKNMLGSNKLIMVCLSISILSCQKQTLSPSDYIKWVENEENGLKKIKTMLPLEIVAQYQPIPYLVAQEFASNSLPKEIFENRTAELQGSHYFKMNLLVKSPNENVSNYRVFDEQGLKKREQYLSFEMQKDIYLIDGKDTLPCALYHFEKFSDLQSSRTFLLAFEEKDKSATNTKILVIDASIFQAGIIKIQFEASIFKNIPNIQLKS